MDNQDFENYLNNRYYAQMIFYKESTTKNHKKYLIFQWILIIFSAMTPVFAALSSLKPYASGIWFFDHLNIGVVVISSIVAILTTGLKTFNYQELWITYRNTYEKLKPEIHYYSFSVGPYGELNINKESLFVSRIEMLLNAEHVQWPPAKTINKIKTGSGQNPQSMHDVNESGDIESD